MLDVDPAHGGEHALDDLLALHGPLPPTVEVLRGGGGRHFYFKHPGGTIRNSTGKLGPGLDIQWAVKSQSRDRLAAMVDLARPDLAVNVDALDADPFVLNVINGVIDLRTGELRPHRQEDLLTRLAPVRFDPTATCPLWDAFLDRIMGGNAALIGYLQRLFGMCATADISEQMLPRFSRLPPPIRPSKTPWRSSSIRAAPLPRKPLLHVPTCTPVTPPGPSAPRITIR